VKHFDIDEGISQWETHTRWLVRALLMPDYLVVFVAAEFFSAREHRNIANQAFRYRAIENATASIEPLGQSNDDTHKPFETELRNAPTTNSGPQTHAPDYPVSRKIVGGTGEWGLTEAFFVRMKALRYKVDERPAKFISSEEELKKLAQSNLLPSASFINTKITELRREPNSLGMVAFRVQISWLMIQTIGRYIDGIPVTLVELNTVAHVCTIAVVTHGFWWYKPRGITASVDLDFAHCEKCRGYFAGHDVFREIEPSRSRSDFWGSPAVRRVASVLIAIVLGVSGVSMVINALAWKAYFPTEAEMVVWRVCTQCLVAGGAMTAQIVWFFDEDYFDIFLVIGALPRIILVILSFISIRRVPVGAYSTPFSACTDWLPHLG
jgi:hypothetical protein